MKKYPIIGKHHLFLFKKQGNLIILQKYYKKKFEIYIKSDKMLLVRKMSIRENFDIYFELVEDVRSQADITYRLSDVLFLIICRIISGCNDLEIIVEFGEERLDFLRNIQN